MTHNQTRLIIGTCMQDLIQYAGREKWYEAKFCADDAPDWNPATFLRKQRIAPGLQEVVLEVEISRDKVPIRNAYKHAGQRASVRVNSGMDRELQGTASCCNPTQTEADVNVCHVDAPSAANEQVCGAPTAAGQHRQW